MNNNLAQTAITQALASNWSQAIATNLEILKADPQDIEALNRLAYAYTENGQLKQAATTAKKVLKLNNFDKIAHKCLLRLQSLNKASTTQESFCSPCSFLEEPGKTKIISLINLGTRQALAGVKSGDEVKYNPQGHGVSIQTLDGKYLGRLPDDVGVRIRTYHKIGKKYQVFIKMVNPLEAKVFVKETATSTKAHNLISFPKEPDPVPPVQNT